MSSSPAKKEGWMTKQGGGIKTWKKRWFSLQGSTIYYYPKPGKKEKGHIDLKKATDFMMAPECKKQPSFKIITAKRTYYIVAESKSECQAWIDVLKETKEEMNGHKTKSSEPSRSARSPPAPPEKKKIGLDDYEKITLLGKGTYGKVHLVKSKYDGEIYAMKTMGKKQLEECEQVEQVLTEKKVLLQTRHPFLVSAHATFQDRNKIFMILDYVPGGELFGRLKEEGKFNERRTLLYAAEIMLGIGHLHSLGFIYRDLKPENILVDEKGHLKITDFGLVKTRMSATNTTNTFCGTPEYIAPEMLQQKPYTRSVDWWSFGILVFEMLTGLPPFYHDNTNIMFRMIIEEEVEFPPDMSREAKDLISRLLDKNPETRLGASEKDVEEIKRHPFFDTLKWDVVLDKGYRPEWVPTLKNKLDVRNFDSEFVNEKEMSPEEVGCVTSSTAAQFQGFTYADSELNDY